MGLLDRFKPQPRWKHTDPLVRVAGVQELPEDEQDLLATLARTDPDARVRRAAVSKLGTVAVLADVVRQDAEAEVRDEAAGVLLDIALGAYEASEAVSLAAVGGLTGLPAAEAQKQLVLVAKTARRETVARRALDAIGADPRAVGTTARRAEHPSIRLEALARLTDVQEIVTTALKTDHKDVALAALERVEDPAALRTLAARAKNAAAQRRARAMVRAADEAEQARAQAEQDRLAAAERGRQLRRDLCRETEALVAPSDWQEAAARLASIERRWSELATEADADLDRRYAEAVAAAKDALARHEAERAESARQAAARAALLSEHTAVLTRIETLAPADVASSLDSLRAAWAALPALPEADKATIDARFDAACRAATARAREAAMEEQTLERLGALCTELETLASNVDAPGKPELRGEWKRLREAWREASASVEGDEALPPLAERWIRADEQLTAREGEAREQRAREERDALGASARAAESLERLATVPDATLKTLDRSLRDGRTALDILETMPGGAERDALKARLEAAHAAIVPRAQELREADDWQRWANASMQEQLIAKMEALGAVEDLAAAARQMRELQAEWKKVSSGPREQGQALWRRFKAAQDAVRAKTDTWFSEQAQVRGGHLQQKLALCEQAEGLADSTDWIQTAEKIKALQAEWKTIGPGPRKEEQAAWERFRTACDRFFTRRHEDLASRKHQWAENLAKKDALCAQAEALASSTDWEHAASELRRLQADWKATGPVRKNKSEAIWQRFRAACDAFFERYKHRHTLDLTARLGSREQVAAEAEALAVSIASPAEGVAPPAASEVQTTLRDLRGRWMQQPPVPREVAAPLAARFEAAVAAIVAAAPDAVTGTEFDAAANQRRLEDLCVRAEKLAGPSPAKREAAVSPASILATQLREALAANTIGGRADDEGKWRSAEQEVRQLQSQWTHVGFVPEPAFRELTSRFQRACQRFFDQRDQRRRAMAGR
jgi:hypothetical protein